MADGPVITFAPLVLERDDFLVLALFQNFSGHFCPGNQRIPMRHVFSVGKHQHLAEGGGLTRIDIQKIDIDRIAFRESPSATRNCLPPVLIIA